MPAEYTQADLAEAAKLAPTLGSKAHERIARALAHRERVGALKEWARHDKVTPDELRQLVGMVERGELFVDRGELVSQEEAVEIDRGVRAGYERAVAKTNEIAAKLDAESAERARKEVQGG